jgi:hypothetical protein
MINLKKGVSTPIAITIIIVLVVIIAGGVLGYQYYWLPKQEVETPKIETSTETPTEILKDEITDWKIYRNEEYGFEIKFPPNWVLNRKSVEENFVEYTDVSTVLRKGDILEKGWIDFSIEIIPTTKTSLQEYFQGFNEQGEREILEEKQITIDNLKAICREELWIAAGFPVISTYFLKNGLFFKLNMKFAKSGPNFTIYKIQFEDLKLNDQILSTFRFID